MDDTDESWKRKRPLACAECRRVRLRCDRKVPCGTCTRRGCATLCPNGTVSPGPGRRMILDDGDKLHDRSEAMRARIEELEAAITSAQGSSKGLITTSSSSASASDHSDEDDALLEKLTARLGTMSIGDKSFFVGPHAVSNHFAPTIHVLPAAQKLFERSLPREVVLTEPSFDGNAIRAVVGQLPILAHARRLISAYRSIDWLIGSSAAPREEMDALVTVLYAIGGPAKQTRDLMSLTMHEVVIFLLALSIGCIVNPEGESLRVESAKYYDIAVAILSTECIAAHPSIGGVRALQLMSWNRYLFDDSNGMNAAYILNGLNAQVARTLGLHRDDAMWSLSEERKQQRRAVFWDFASWDAMCSEALGRPSTLTLAHCDARLPIDTERFLNAEGEWQSSYSAWQRSFTRRCQVKLNDHVFNARKKSHATILEMDRLVREHPISESLRVVNVGELDPSVPLERNLQRTVIFVSTQKSLMLLHRDFFAFCMAERPLNLVKAKYASSVLAAFRSAIYIVKSVAALYQLIPATIRFCWLWNTAFSACVVLSAITIKYPGSILGPGAWTELDATYSLFERLAPTSPGIQRVLPELRRMHQAAKASRSLLNSPNYKPNRTTPGCSIQERDSFAFMLGHARLIDSSAAGDDDDSDSPYAALRDNPLLAGQPVAGSSSAVDMSSAWGDLIVQMSSEEY